MKRDSIRRSSTLWARGAAITALWAGWVLMLPGTSPAQAPGAPAAARCVHLARIENTLDPAVPNVTLMIRHDADLQSVATRLIRAYGVQLHGLRSIHALVLTHVTAELVERLRCEPDVELLSFSVPTYSN